MGHGGPIIARAMAAPAAAGSALHDVRTTGCYDAELHRRLATALGFTPDVAPHLHDDDVTVLRETMPTVDVDA